MAYYNNGYQAYQPMYQPVMQNQQNQQTGLNWVQGEAAAKANLAASQTAQTVNIRDSIIDELRSCPIPSQPVYGSQPIFTCPNNNNSGCGCGCGGNF